jgi:hypothetical protein
MKIIQDNYNKQKSEQFICEHCNSILEYNKEDIRLNNNNAVIKCPCCGHECIIETYKCELKFPKDFYQFGISNGSVKIDDEEITLWIKDCINWLENNPNEPFRYRGSGNTFLCVFNHEDEYYIMVAKNYFDTSIDK